MDVSKNNGAGRMNAAPYAKTLRRNALWFFAGLLSSLSPFFGTHPFGASLLCASNGGGLALLAGIAVSAPFGAAGTAELLCDAAVLIIKYLTLKNKKEKRRHDDIPSTAFKTSLSLVAGAVPVLINAVKDGVTPVYVHMIKILTVPLITFFLCGLFEKRPPFGRIHKTSGIVCASCCAIFLVSKIKTDAFSLPFILSSVLTLAVSEKSGIVFGGLSGFIGAFASDMPSIPALGCSGLISGLFFRQGKAAGILSFALTVSSVYLYFNDMRGAPFVLLNTGIAVALYLPLSKRLPNDVFSSYAKQDDAPKEKSASEPFADAFSDISGALYKVSGIKKKERDDREDRSAEYSAVIAGNCAALSEVMKSGSRSSERENKKNNVLTKKAMCRLSVMGIKGDRIKVTGERKVKIKVYNVNPETFVRSGSEISKKLGEACGLEFSAPVIEKSARRCDMVLESVPMIKTESSRFCITKKGERICGDSVRSFATDEGISYDLICDGMGSGKDAALSSDLAASSLEKLLCAGADMKTSLNAVNSFLLSSSNETFTTVDLLKIDNYTSRVTILKAGAAPTFTVSKGKITKTAGKALPVGIFGRCEPQITELDAKPGDYIIMTSDGATSDENDENMIISSAVRRDYSDARELALKLYEAILKNKKSDDDVSVCVVRILKS